MNQNAGGNNNYLTIHPTLLGMSFPSANDPQQQHQNAGGAGGSNTGASRAWPGATWCCAWGKEQWGGGHQERAGLHQVFLNAGALTALS